MERLQEPVADWAFCQVVIASSRITIVTSHTGGGGWDGGGGGWEFVVRGANHMLECNLGLPGMVRESRRVTEVMEV